MKIHSSGYKCPSMRKPMVIHTAAMKKIKSRIKLLFPTLNSVTQPMVPATMAVMKLAAPMSSPTAMAALLDLMAMTVLKTSGDPFPIARNVTPARFSGMLRTLAMVWRFGEKKSLAAMPMVEKRRPSHSVKSANPANLL
jgi:hypothetical protein